jgi:hypothetical protein
MTKIGCGSVFFRVYSELLAVWSMHKTDGSKIARGYNFVKIDSDSKFIYLEAFFKGKVEML